MLHHVAARDDVDLLIGEALPQASQICRAGDVHRDLNREQEDIVQVRDGHDHDLPADPVGLRLL